MKKQDCPKRQQLFALLTSVLCFISHLPGFRFMNFLALL